MFNNWIAGLNDVRLYKTADDILRNKSGVFSTDIGDISYDTLRGMLKDSGMVGQSGFFDVGDYMRTADVSGSKLRTAARLPRQVMGWVEDRLRVPLFLDGLKKGTNPRDAARRVIKFHFDYMPEGYTNFEKIVMRRVIPFYTWTRHNIPLQLEQMVMQPGKYSGVFKTSRSFGVQQSSEEEQVLPIWLKEQFTLKSEGGYWTGVGLPLEEATQKLASPLRGFGISLSPFLKIPMERITGWNIFKDMKIDEDRNGKFYQNLPQPIKSWLDYKEHTAKDGKKYYTVNPEKKY